MSVTRHILFVCLSHALYCASKKWILFSVPAAFRFHCIFSRRREPFGCRFRACVPHDFAAFLAVRERRMVARVCFSSFFFYLLLCSGLFFLFIFFFLFLDLEGSGNKMEGTQNQNAKPKRRRKIKKGKGQARIEARTDSVFSFLRVRAAVLLRCPVCLDI